MKFKQDDGQGVEEGAGDGEREGEAKGEGEGDVDGLIDAARLREMLAETEREDADTDSDRESDGVAVADAKTLPDTELLTLGEVVIVAAGVCDTDAVADTVGVNVGDAVVVAVCVDENVGDTEPVRDANGVNVGDAVVDSVALGKALTLADGEALGENDVTTLVVTLEEAESDRLGDVDALVLAVIVARMLAVSVPLGKTLPLADGDTLALTESEGKAVIDAVAAGESLVLRVANAVTEVELLIDDERVNEVESAAVLVVLGDAEAEADELIDAATLALLLGVTETEALAAALAVTVAVTVAEFEPNGLVDANDEGEEVTERENDGHVMVKIRITLLSRSLK